MEISVKRCQKGAQRVGVTFVLFSIAEKLYSQSFVKYIHFKLSKIFVIYIFSPFAGHHVETFCTIMDLDGLSLNHRNSLHIIKLFASVDR